MSYAIVPAEMSHVVAIHNRMRRVDYGKIEQAGLNTIRELNRVVASSVFSWAGFIDDEVVCLWGVQCDDLLSRKGLLWLITTPNVEERAFTFVRASQRTLEKMFETFDTIEGYVEADFDRSIKWLRWLKFAIEPPFMVKDKQIRYFYRSKGKNGSH
jgi:hypothetical protein